MVLFLWGYVCVFGKWKIVLSHILFLFCQKHVWNDDWRLMLNCGSILYEVQSIMLRNILFQPIGPSEKDYRVNFFSSVLTPRSFEKYSVKSLETQEYGLWGMRINRYVKTNPEWEKLSPGDFVMFYFKGYSIAISQVFAKIRSAVIAKDVWNDGLWELIYFVDPKKTMETRIPWSSIVSLTKYKKSFVPMRGILFSQTSVLFYEALSRVLNIETEYFELDVSA